MHDSVIEYTIQLSDAELKYLVHFSQFVHFPPNMADHAKSNLRHTQLQVRNLPLSSGTANSAKQQIVLDRSALINCSPIRVDTGPAILISADSRVIHFAHLYESDKQHNGQHFCYLKHRTSLKQPPGTKTLQTALKFQTRLVNFTVCLSHTIITLNDGPPDGGAKQINHSADMALNNITKCHHGDA